MYGIIVFFFFQAEDGIRDDLVTGVQTCALPIFWGEVVGDATTRSHRGSRAIPHTSALRLTRSHGTLRHAGRLGSVHPMSCRSEERRVGKECRSRWSPYH